MGECCPAECQHQVQWTDANMGPRGTVLRTHIIIHVALENYESSIFCFITGPFGQPTLQISDSSFASSLARYEDGHVRGIYIPGICVC